MKPNLEKYTLKQQLVLQLQEQKMSYPKACAKADEILAKQEFIVVERKKPLTVGSYYKKYKERCQKKFANI